MENLIELLNKKNLESNVSGNWFSIVWTPNLYTNEKLNIGVGLIDQNGELSIQVLDHYERINCLYDNKKIEFQLELACKVSREIILKNGIDNRKVTPQITCEVNGFAQGKSVDEVLSQLFSSVVTLGKPRKKKSKPKFASKSRDTIYNGLKERLKINLALNYSQLVPEDPFVTINDSDYKRSLYLPYRNNKGVGTLVSAAYSDNQRVKCNLNDGFWDLDLYSQKHRNQKNSIFLLLPDDSLKESNKIIIENELDKFTWLMNSHGIHVGAHVETELLADEISEWCLSAA